MKIICNKIINLREESTSPSMSEVNIFSSSHEMVACRIIDEINDGILEIPAQQKPLIGLPLPKNSNQFKKNRMELIAHIKQNRTKTMKDLNDLEKKECEIKNVISALSKSGVKSLERSVYSPDEKQKIKEIILLQKHSEEIKKNKHEEIYRNFSNYLKKERMEEEKKIEKIRLEHRRIVERNKGSLELRKRSREEFEKESSLRVNEVRKRNYSYIIKSNLDAEIEEAKKKEDQVKLKELKEKFKINFKVIDDHEKKYQSILEQKQAERKGKIKTEGEKSISHYSPNKFHQLLLKEENQRKKDELRKMSMPLEYKSRIKNFENNVLSNYRTATKKSFESNTTSPKTAKSRRALSQVDRISQGNEFLTQAKKLRKDKDEPRIVTEPQIRKYLDYLQSVRRSKKSKTMQKFQSILKNKSEIGYVDANEAWDLLEEIEAKSKKSENQKILDSIQNKIDLLKVLL